MQEEKRETVLGFIIKNIVMPIAVVLILTRVVIVNAHVPTSSMENTIMTGDYLIGNRLDHNYKRGDIIIFHAPDNPSTYYIKRIVGMPGETVEIKQGIDGYAEVYVNGAVLFENYLKTDMFYDQDFKVEIPDGAYFVMGDNRNASYDARYWHTHTVDESLIIGVAALRYWPIDKIGFVK